MMARVMVTGDRLETAEGEGRICPAMRADRLGSIAVVLRQAMIAALTRTAAHSVATIAGKAMIVEARGIVGLAEAPWRGVLRSARP